RRPPRPDGRTAVTCRTHPSPHGCGRLTRMDRPLQLRIPGPVPMPPAVARELSRPMINHRGPDAHALHRRVNEGMRKVFGTREDVAILTTSGTGVMEAAVANTIEAG